MININFLLSTKVKNYKFFIYRIELYIMFLDVKKFYNDKMIKTKELKNINLIAKKYNYKLECLSLNFKRYTNIVYNLERIVNLYNYLINIHTKDYIKPYFKNNFIYCEIPQVDRQKVELVITFMSELKDGKHIYNELLDSYTFIYTYSTNSVKYKDKISELTMFKHLLSKK